MLSPETDTPRTYVPEGFEVKEANNLRAVTQLQKRLEEQELLQRDIEVEDYKQQYLAARQQKRANLLKLLLSSETSEYDKIFIERYLQVREDRRAKYEQRFAERNCFLNVLAFDENKAQQEIIDSMDVNR